MSTEPKDMMVELDESACWALLRTAEVGRLAIVVNHRPEIFPINFVVDRATVVFRTAQGTKLDWGAGRDVAFEVDGYEPESGEAWSVVVKGLAREIKQMYEALDALELPLFPWHGSSKPHIVRNEPDQITGRRFRGADSPSRHPAHEG
ncbi:MAG TPA: pyridoxamine 5'-phosphate oxidase family protein [Jiangellaceae bacterium]|nr:pyridoxamine 5'-phosphate oxidase family protein [Jiangellaceae bacterium]